MNNQPSHRGPTSMFAFEGMIAWIGLAVLLVGAILWADRGPLREKTDFSVTYIGARIVCQGRGGHLYDLAEQQRIKSVLLKNAEPLIYEHPPFEAFLLQPLGALSYKSAYLIWGLLNVLVWLSLPILLRPYAPVPRNELGYLSLWLLFVPLGIALYQGQSSLFLLLIVLLTFLNLRHGNEFPAGLWLGVGLFKFQFVIPFVLIFLLRRKWRMIVGFATTAGALTLLSLIAVGWNGLVSYFHLLSNIIRNANNISYGAARDMATLQGFVHTVLGHVLSATLIRYLVALASLGILLLVAWVWESNQKCASDEHANVMFGVSIVAALVTSSHLFAHDLSPLILAAFLVLPLIHKMSFSLQTVLWLALALFWTPVYFVLVKWHCMYLLVPVLMIFGAAATLGVKAVVSELAQQKPVHVLV